jgi:hypothetical protein
VAQLLKKCTEEKAASDAVAEATHRSSILLEYHRSNGKVFMRTMKTYYEFSDWKSTKDSRNIGPQTEAILLVFYDIPCFFSQMELEVFLGCVSPNHNVDGALIKMAEKEMLVRATNKVGTPIYYLGKFAMQALDRTKITDVDARQNKFLESIKIHSDNGYRVRNKRQSTARTSSNNKRQESSASKKGSKKSSVTPSAKKSKPNPNPPIFTSDKESPKNPTEAPSKDKDGALINGKSTSDDESEKDANSSSSDNESETSNNSSSSDEDSKNPTIPQSTTSVSVISWTQITDRIPEQFEMAATHILHSNHSSTQHPSN